MLDIAHIRQEYMRAGLDERDVPAEPLAQFKAWFDDASNAELPLPNAMSLSTVAADGKPASRIVLLKGVDHGGFVFYTNYDSRKGREISSNAHAALLFGWLPLERQVRIEGTLTRVTAQESDNYFASRPLGSRHAAIASPQSESIASRAALEMRYQAAVKTHGDAVQRPAHWGGYRLMPVEIEFWQGRENRLHDRLLFSKTTGGWRLSRLAP
ncbi:MAG: pyridoxamine 5'-phosphate oxidase [Burkholderiales bacterium]